MRKELRDNKQSPLFNVNVLCDKMATGNKIVTVDWCCCILYVDEKELQLRSILKTSTYNREQQKSKYSHAVSHAHAFAFRF